MRPEKLFPLFSSVGDLKGVGIKTVSLVQKLCGPVKRDILFHLPVSVIDRRAMPPLSVAPSGEIITALVQVTEHIPPPVRKKPYRIFACNDTGEIELVFFHFYPDSLKRLLPVGRKVYVSGRIERFGNRVQMLHPDYIVPENKIDELPLLESVYSLTAGISNKYMIRWAGECLAALPDFDEWIEPSLMQRKKYPSFKEALYFLHKPTDIGKISISRERLAYDELLANQLALGLVRTKMKKRTGRILKGTGTLRKALLSALPFHLTSAQERVLSEISGDMSSPFAMLRLLQGDVGSGKTIVALCALLQAVESGVQAAFLAPTDILIRQHFATLSKMCRNLPIRISLLTGREKGKKREEILSDLKEGKINIMLGTHALFQEGVEFQNLGFVVIDEQHRFGVDQRLKMEEKGGNPDMLVMTATPIPRTLSLTEYGDMDCSEIDEMPPSRKKVVTRVISGERTDELSQKLRNFLKTGEQAYWVCPLVEESEKSDLTAAEERFESLNQLFPNQVGLIHGKMKGEEKDTVMQKFISAEFKILVATTVIEVGVDVPNATLMIIEHAERFGLAQLHQLRGRIGRGSKESQCLLLYKSPLSKIAEERLKTMRETEDGFLIAEKDLELRGAGEVLGTRQSGFEEFKIAEMPLYRDLAFVAHKDAQMILNTDAGLKTKRGEALRLLLYLFSKEEEIKTLRSG